MSLNLFLTNTELLRLRKKQANTKELVHFSTLTQHRMLNKPGNHPKLLFCDPKYLSKEGKNSELISPLFLQANAYNNVSMTCRVLGIYTIQVKDSMAPE